MAKSRSRSPSWKHRPPTSRSPEHHRQRHFQDSFNDDEGYRRDPRRPIHWDDGRPRQNNSRIPPYNRFNNKPYEHNSFSTNVRDSPVEDVNQMKRIYSPERHREGNRRFPPKYPEEAPYREHDRDFNHHRTQGRNVHDDPNDFRVGRRENNFHGPPHREHDWEWRENKDHGKQQMHTDKYFQPPRRSSEDFVERNYFPKRYPEERDFREHEPHPKRARDTERLDFRQPPRNSHWKADQTFRPFHSKECPKDTDLRDSNPIIHRTDTVAFTKIEYDYSHKSPTYVGPELILKDDRAQKHSRQDERKPNPSKSSQHRKTADCNSRERGKYTAERPPDASSTYGSKKCHSTHSESNKNDIEVRSPNNKLKERGKKEDESRKTPASPNNRRGKSPKSSDPKSASKISPTKETLMVKVDLKKPMDKYSNAANHNERQTSEDLVVTGRKENFHPVFEHLQSATGGVPGTPKTEFTQEIITIIHQVKENYFKSDDTTLHERFSKMQAESNKQDVDLNKVVLQTNPEIHRRFDISLADLKSKSLKRSDPGQASHRVIEDPNDLRHDIERRRKERLQSEDDGSSDVGTRERDGSASYSRTQKDTTGGFQKSARVARPPFRKSAGRPQGSYYRGEANQSHTPQSHFEKTEEIRKSYKGRGNTAAGI
ncbi:BCLAF1 and THRAP3 family member 3 [Ascaphus truei]|uniref:BCLAF1 and THRAP3 family member 3 n=1 Tax=Ascaphus truei TaxID=8439 RepID=UPI003F5AC687